MTNKPDYHAIFVAKYAPTIGATITREDLIATFQVDASNSYLADKKLVVIRREINLKENPLIGKPGTFWLRSKNGVTHIETPSTPKELAKKRSDRDQWFLNRRGQRFGNSHQMADGASRLDVHKAQQDALLRDYEALLEERENFVKIIEGFQRTITNLSGSVRAIGDQVSDLAENQKVIVSALKLGLPDIEPPLKLVKK
jgi:hypothetical protein